MPVKQREDMPSADNPFPLDPPSSWPPALQRALVHPQRRQILRILNKSSVPLTAHELMRESCLQLALSQLSYHLAFLRHGGTTSVQTGPLKQPPAFESKVADDPAITLFLQALEERDQQTLRGDYGAVGG